MNILVMGELLYEHVYEVEEALTFGQRLSAGTHNVYPGGKALYQALAAKRAGADVTIASVVGHDASTLKSTLSLNGIRTEEVRETDAASGHSVVFLSPDGKSCSLSYRGRKLHLDAEEIEGILRRARSSCSHLLIENGIRLRSFALEKAKELGYVTLFCLSPWNEALRSEELPPCDTLILGRFEAKKWLRCDENDDLTLFRMLCRSLPADQTFILTCGSEGIYVRDREISEKLPGLPREVRDVTGAGDCFAGYFAALLAEGKDRRASLFLASVAAGLTVSKSGGAIVAPSRVLTEEKAAETDVRRRLVWENV